ncbi:MAG: tetratricopeptide repeat protein [Bacteroidota bacterium]
MKFLNKTCLIICFLVVEISYSQTENQSFNQGRGWYDQGEYSKAIEAFEQAVKQVPNKADYYYWLGSANIGALDKASFFQKATLASDAKSNLLKAIDLDPKHVSARVTLANYYIQAPAIAGGSYSKALEQAEEIKKIDLFKGVEIEALVYLNDEEYDKAEQLYLDMIRDGTNNKKVYYRLSVISISRKDFKQALAYCQKSIEVYPNYLMGYYQFGKVASLGNIEPQAGIKYLTQYLQSDYQSGLPKKHWAYFRLGEIYRNLNQTAEAKKSYQESLAIKEDFNEAKAALKKLN